MKLKLHKKQRMRDDISYVKQSDGDRRATTLFWPYELMNDFLQTRGRFWIFVVQCGGTHRGNDMRSDSHERSCIKYAMLAIPVYTTHVNHETRDHKKLLAVPIGRRV